VGDNTTTTKLNDRGESKEEDTKTNIKGGEASKKNREAKDTQDEETKQSDTSVSIINSPINPRNWEDILIGIGSPSKHVLTKENYELVNSVLNAYEYAILHNIYDFIKEASTNRCFHERLLKFLTISKIGASLSQFKQIRLNALVQALTQQVSMYNTALQQLGVVVSSFQGAYILREYISITPPITDLQIPNIALDIKVSSVIATLIGALVSIGLEIGMLKNDIRSQIALDEYCLTGCSSGCIGFSSIEESYKELRKLLSDSNTDMLKEYADKAMKWLEQVVSIELKYLEEHVKPKVDLAQIKDKAKDKDKDKK
jgi:hypothetical protein